MSTIEERPIRICTWSTITVCLYIHSFLQLYITYTPKHTYIHIFIAKWTVFISHQKLFSFRTPKVFKVFESRWSESGANLFENTVTTAVYIEYSLKPLHSCSRAEGTQCNQFRRTNFCLCAYTFRYCILYTHLYIYIVICVRWKFICIQAKTTFVLWYMIVIYCSIGEFCEKFLYINHILFINNERKKIFNIFFMQKFLFLSLRNFLKNAKICDWSFFIYINWHVTFPTFLFIEWEFGHFDLEGGNLAESKLYGVRFYVG